MRRRPAPAMLAGAGVGMLGGLIGLGGAEFRLPLLMHVFGFAALPAVILNKAASLVVVSTALPSRLLHVPWEAVLGAASVVATLLAGSLAGAWVGAGWAVRMRTVTLHRVLAVLLVLMAALLLVSHRPDAPPAGPLLAGLWLVAAGVCAGFAIGVVAALMGVAGGELLIPTLVLLYGVDLKLAGSLSLAVSLPTMIVGFARYSRDRSFAVLRAERRFLGWLVVGSVIGAVAGAGLLGVVPTAVLLPLLALVLVISAWKTWRH